MRTRGQVERLTGTQLSAAPSSATSLPEPSLSNVRVADFFRGVKDIIDDIPGAVVNSGAKSSVFMTKGNADVSNVAASKTVAEGPLLGKVETALESGASAEAKAAKAAAGEGVEGATHMEVQIAKTTNHEIGITGLPKANRQIMESKDWELAKLGYIDHAHAIVDKCWTDGQTAALKAKLDPNHDLVFLSVPSTTGLNKLPDALGERLAKELGGEYVDISGVYKVDAVEAMKDIAKLDRPFTIRNYIILNPQAVASLKGKQVVLTEDILTTGSSARQFALELRRQGVEVQTVAGLMGNARLDATPQLVDKLHRTLRNAGIEIKGRKLAEVLSSGEIESIIDRINQTGGAHERAALARRIQGLFHSRTADPVEKHSR